MNKYLTALIFSSIAFGCSTTNAEIIPPKLVSKYQVSFGSASEMNNINEIVEIYEIKPGECIKYRKALITVEYSDKNSQPKYNVTSRKVACPISS